MFHAAIYPTGAFISAAADRRRCGRPVVRGREWGCSILRRARILRRRASASASWSARSASNRLNWIFFSKPCGKSGEHASRATGLACGRLRDHRGDDVTPAARRAHGRADVCVGGGQPRRLLPSLEGVCAAAGRDCGARHDPACGAGQPPLWLPAGHGGAAAPRAWCGHHKRVWRRMRRDNLLGLRKRPFVPVTTDSRHVWRVVPNLARGLVPTDLDQLWVADITYVRLGDEFAFLAVLLDAFTHTAIRSALS